MIKLINKYKRTQEKRKGNTEISEQIKCTEKDARYTSKYISIYS